MLKEVVASVVSAILAMWLLVACVYWTLYGPVLQVMAWAWVMDLWAPSIYPVLASLWYWVLPVVSTALWLLVTLRCVIEGVDVYWEWGVFNLLLWSPLWFVPTVSVILAVLSFLAFVNIWRWHGR
jgi:hypothetical protein